MIDLRSDTVTRPTTGMLEYMLKAGVGDDVFGEDPSVNELESLAAEMFGMESALFCPSGTMSNQIAIKAHTHPGDEVICDKTAHVYQYEGGGIAANSGAQVRLLEGDRGRFNAAMVQAAINPDDVHKARTSLVCLENTSNRGGGSCYELAEIERIRETCDSNKLQFHLDGARLFNALVATGQSAKSYGELFHTISVCLNKGLGCPIGSILIGNKQFIKKARRIRKVFGGGMRQAGFMAACGIYALQNHIDRLNEDHDHAKTVSARLRTKGFIKDILPVTTNIIIFEVSEGKDAKKIVASLNDKNIKCLTTSPTHIRMVFHLDINADDIQVINKAIDAIS
ncbi:MAG TPA: GntG family PLP-dependent aldolase [Flavitalea sp.]|nr:GntG family PLP-dependent aldolase [Flavitalea sp.]